MQGPLQTALVLVKETDLITGSCRPESRLWGSVMRMDGSASPGQPGSGGSAGPVLGPSCAAARVPCQLMVQATRGCASDGWQRGPGLRAGLCSLLLGIELGSVQGDLALCAFKGPAPGDREAWRATVHRVARESEMTTEQQRSFLVSEQAKCLERKCRRGASCSFVSCKISSSSHKSV